MPADEYQVELVRNVEEASRVMAERGVLLASICLEIEYFTPGNRVRAIARRCGALDAGEASRVSTG